MAGGTQSQGVASQITPEVQQQFNSIAGANLPAPTSGFGGGMLGIDQIKNNPPAMGGGFGLGAPTTQSQAVQQPPQQQQAQPAPAPQPQYQPPQQAQQPMGYGNYYVQQYQQPYQQPYQPYQQQQNPYQQPYQQQQNPFYRRPQSFSPYGFTK